MEKQPHDTIFVSIASYRDPECQLTVKQLFEKAKHPERIFIGIVWQYDGDADNHCFVEPCPRPDQVRIMHLPATDAKGPCFARALAMQLYRGEKYFFQTDSHMRFADNWDARCIDMLKQCPSKKPVLTTYAVGYERDKPTPTYRQPNCLYAHHFGGKGMLHFGGYLLKQCPSKPVPTPFLGGGFIFCDASVIDEVPYDGSLKHLFFGEEISYAARLWTHGWDLFLPTENLAWHLWTKTHRPLFDKDEKKKTKRILPKAEADLKARSKAAVRRLLGQPDVPPRPSAPSKSLDNESTMSTAPKLEVTTEDRQECCAPHDARYKSNVIEYKAGRNVLHPLDSKTLASLPKPILPRGLADTYEELTAKNPRRRGLYGPYALGNVRTLEQYEDFSGLDFATLHISEKAAHGLLPPDAMYNVPGEPEKIEHLKLEGSTSPEPEKVLDIMRKAEVPSLTAIDQLATPLVPVAAADS